MAYNPSPRVKIAREFAEQFSQEIVIIFHIGKDGRVGYASYGKNKNLCDRAKIIADEIFENLIKE